MQRLKDEQRKLKDEQQLEVQQLQNTLEQERGESEVKDRLMDSVTERFEELLLVWHDPPCNIASCDHPVE